MTLAETVVPAGEVKKRIVLRFRLHWIQNGCLGRAPVFFHGLKRERLRVSEVNTARLNSALMRPLVARVGNGGYSRSEEPVRSPPTDASGANWPGDF